MSHKVIVIGSGLGGLCAAILLAKKGFQVQLFELNSKPGGKMNEIHEQGFRFDTGPSLLTMPFVIDEIFAECGVDRKNYLEYVPIDPICRYFWSDGTQLDASMDVSQMIASLTNLSPEDAENYPSFLNYTKRIYDLTANVFLFSPIHEINKILKWQNLSKLFKIHQIDPFRTVHEGVLRFFKHPKTIQLFDRYATYNGSDPYRAPATLNIIPYVEYGLGSFYIKGGMYRLVEKLVELAQQSGVVIQTNCRVDKIISQRQKIQGVEIKNDFLPADFVVCNGDVVVSYNELIEGFDFRRKKLSQLEPSLSGLVFLWGMNKKFPQLAHHNIIFSDDYQSEFKQIFYEKIAPTDPTIYIAISSKKDPEHAPENGENWFVLLNMPSLNNKIDWKMAVDALREIILKKLMQTGLDARDHIQYEKILTPEDFYRLYRSNGGSIYGIASNDRNSAFKRPPNRNRDIQGLYFAGGSTHPGGGVPLTMLSGKLCADLIAENE
ncbi:phytoene desaturase [candidate division KSB1 bacterium]|nr:phytoene desaturase [candidate division KSB1 bacterium]